MSLLFTEEVTLQPWAQAIVLVRTEKWACSKGTGLITLIRSRQVLHCRFSTAYGYVEEGVEAITISNATNKQVVLKKIRIVAEFHPRNRDSFTALRCDREDREKHSGGHNHHRDAAPPERNESRAACTLTMDHSGAGG